MVFRGGRILLSKEGPMKIEEIMTQKVVFASMDDTLAVIKGIFDKLHFHHVLVLDEEGKLAGIISDRDILKNLSPFADTVNEQERDARTLEKKAHQIMTRQPIVVLHDMELEAAVETLIDKGISCLPVSTKEGRVVGLVTWKDILRHSFKRCEAGSF